MLLGAPRWSHQSLQHSHLCNAAEQFSLSDTPLLTAYSSCLSGCTTALRASSNPTASPQAVRGPRERPADAAGMDAQGRREASRGAHALFSPGWAAGGGFQLLGGVDLHPGSGTCEENCFQKMSPLLLAVNPDHLGVKSERGQRQCLLRQNIKCPPVENGKTLGFEEGSKRWCSLSFLRWDFFPFFFL